MKDKLLSFFSRITSFRPFHKPLSNAQFDSIFKQWNDALRTQNPDNVCALYSEEAVLLPTVSNQVRFGRPAIRDYFVEFLKYKPQGTIIKHFTKTFDSNLCMDSGVYEFELTKNEAAEKVLARFTFIYEKINGRWMITVHHSSAMPQPTSPAKPKPLSTKFKNLWDAFRGVFSNE